VTGKDADRFNFKVPTLRNVELTYPYFHDGEAATLTQAVDTMGRLQLGRQFSDDENAKIVAFLKTLTGDQPRISCRSCRRRPTPPRVPSPSTEAGDAMPATPDTALQARLQQAGIGPTLQRLAIAETLLRQPCHMTADQVLAAARGGCPACRARRSTARCSCSCGRACCVSCPSTARPRSTTPTWRRTTTCTTRTPAR
jgi:hypothetical protein